MTRRVSIAEQAARTSVPFVELRFTSAPNVPRIVLSLTRAGDMRRSESGEAARAVLFDRLGIDRTRVRSLHQVHSRRVLFEAELDPRGAEGDGLISTSRDAILAVTVADCYPVFLFDRRTGAFGIVHSGWRGTGIALDALRMMQKRLATRASDVSALIGPGIGPCCYHVPAERARTFSLQWGDSTVVEVGGRSFLDLARANEELLRAAGVEEMTLVTDCTSCSQCLGSYRRQGPESYTLMLALIGYFG